MRRSIFHAVLGLLGTLMIVLFLSATLISEIFLNQNEVILVKTSIAHYGIYGLIGLMAFTGISGNVLSKGKAGDLLSKKRQRMLLIAINGIVIMVPSALFLSYKANLHAFDVFFYGVQTLEVVVGFIQLYLMTQNFRDGIKMAKRKRLAML